MSQARPSSAGASASAATAAAATQYNPATQESFVLIASDASQHVAEIATQIARSGLRQTAKLHLNLTPVMSERLLRIILSASAVRTAGSSTVTSQSSLGVAQHNNNNPLVQQPSSSSSSSSSSEGTASNAQKRFGASLMGTGDVSGILLPRYEPVRPTIDECEAYSSIAGPVTALLISCADPRVDVVSRVSALVGDTSSSASFSLSMPNNTSTNNSSQAGITFQRRFATGSGIAEIVAPATAAQATRALHLLREFGIRAEAAVLPGTNVEALGLHSLLTSTTAAASTNPLSPLAAEAAASSSFSFSSSPTITSISANTAAAAAASEAALLSKIHLVDMDMLYDFIFPRGQQHAASTGRLIVFALYGPLTVDGHLTGGKKNGRYLTESEISTMVSEAERDDILAVYTSGSVLGDIASVLTDVNAAGNGYPRMSRAQLQRMLADLPRDSRGRCSYHDIQKRVLGSRLQRVEDMQQMYPAIVPEAADTSPAAMAKAKKLGLPPGTTMSQMTRICEPPKAFGRGKLPATLALAHGRTLGASNMKASPLQPNAAKQASTAITLPISAAGGLDVRLKLGEIQALRMQEALLHRNTTRIAELQDACNPGAVASMAANTKIIRADLPGALDTFDRTSFYSLYPGTGTRVPGSLSRRR